MPNTSGSENFQKHGLRTEVHEQPIVFIEIFSSSFMFHPGSEGNTKKTRLCEGK